MSTIEQLKVLYRVLGRLSFPSSYLLCCTIPTEIKSESFLKKLEGFKIRKKNTKVQKISIKLELYR